MIKVSEYLSCGLPGDRRRPAREPGDSRRRRRCTSAPAMSTSWPNASIEVLFDPIRRDELAAAARRRARALLWEHSEPRLLMAYRHLLDGGPAVEGDQHVERRARHGVTWTTIPFLDLRRLHASIRPALDEAFDRVLRTGAFIDGSELEAFEQAFARAHGLPAAAGVGSGTDALALALRALGHRSRRRGRRAVDDVHRHGRSSHPLRRDAGHRRRRRRHVAAHVRSTWSRCSRRGRRRSIPVHLFGHVVAPGGHERVEGARAASCSKMRRKRISAIATGSASVTAVTLPASASTRARTSARWATAAPWRRSTPAIVAEVRRLRNHGSVTKYDHQVVGFCSRLDGLQAALLG